MPEDLRENESNSSRYLLSWIMLMPRNKNESCLSDLGGLVQIFGGTLVLGAQIGIIFLWLEFVAVFPTIPPELLPLYDLIAQMLLVSIVAMILCGIIIIVSGLITFWHSGSIGGFLSLFFGIAVIAAGVWMYLGIQLYPGIIHFIGAILAITGGILSIAPAVKRPQDPRSRRKRNKEK